MPYDTPVMDYIALKKDEESRQRQQQQQLAGAGHHYKQAKTPHIRGKRNSTNTMPLNSKDLENVMRAKAKKNAGGSIGGDYDKKAVRTIQASTSGQRELGLQTQHDSHVGLIIG